MALRIAINGLGRIGRSVVRSLADGTHEDIQLVAVNGPAATRSHLHLLKYDSIQGPFHGVTQTGEDMLDIGKGTIKVFHERDPKVLPWGELGIDVVLECSGQFKTREELQGHIDAGAKKVLVSAPAEGAETMIVYGVNHDTLNPDHRFISVGSCTTNCLAPVAKVLNDKFGIAKGFMTTIHAYTNDQNVLDNNHKDLRRARAATLSMIPTSTGAAKAIGKVLPELEGKLDGVAVRVPTPCVSLVDLTFEAEKPVCVDTVNQAIKEAAGGKMAGVLGYNDEPLVSVDFLKDSRSSIFDGTGTKIIGENLVRVASWYDNEWGFSQRMIDVASLLK